MYSTKLWTDFSPKECPPVGDIFFVQFDYKISLDKSCIMWYNGRPSLTALAGFCVMSSDNKFFVHFHYKTLSTRFSHNANVWSAEGEPAGRNFRENLAYGNFLLNLAASIWPPILPKLDPPYMRGISVESSKSRIKNVKLTKYLYKKFDNSFPFVKNVPPDIL